MSPITLIKVIYIVLIFVRMALVCPKATSNKPTLCEEHLNIFVGVINSVDPSWPSAVDWVHQVPEGFRKLLNYIYNNFGQPEIVVTENGWAQNVTNAGIQDQDRINYIQVNMN